MADPNAGHIWPKSDPQQLTIINGRSKNVPPFYQRNLEFVCLD